MKPKLVLSARLETLLPRIQRPPVYHKPTWVKGKRLKGEELERAKAAILARINNPNRH